MFPLNTSQYLRNLTSQTGGEGPSPAIWQRVEAELLMTGGGNRGTVHFDDFTNFGGAVATNVGNKQGYKTFEDTSSAIDQLTGVDGGVVRFLTDTTDNANLVMQGGFSTGVLGAISDTAGDNFLTAFECSVRINQIGNTYGWVVGLGEPGMAANNGVQADDGTLVTDKGMIGFRVLETDGDLLQAFYIKSGQTAVAWTFKVPVAATWYKLGFLHDPRHKASERIKFFLDGAEQSTYVTATQIAAATFPDAVYMHLLASVKNQTTTASSVDMGFWGYAQVGIA